MATLSWLVELDHVVVEATNDAEAHADVVRALLTDDEVNFTNDVATLVAVPTTVRRRRARLPVWSSTATCWATATRRQRARRRRVVTQGELTTLRLYYDGCTEMRSGRIRTVTRISPSRRLGYESTSQVLLRQSVDDLVGAVGGEAHDGAANRDAHRRVVGIGERDRHASRPRRD